MLEIALDIKTRKEKGKQYTKKLIREGKIPGVYYFRGKENIPFIVEQKQVQSLAGHESGLITVNVDGKEEKKCIIREIQFDPINAKPIHVDLMGILLTEKVTVAVPVHLIGTPVGVKNSGGILQHIIREIEIQCLPADIPQHIEVDVTNLDIGDSAHISEIKLDKVEILGEDEMVIATVGAPRIAEEVVTEEVTAEPEVISKGEEEDEE
ncbi:50S ribosomal protein L25 [candidate division KSB1 bacterium]|nr:50S ribosomal protein L25 [candidate division KSB1 bacterium]